MFFYDSRVVRTVIIMINPKLAAAFVFVWRRPRFWRTYCIINTLIKTHFNADTTICLKKYLKYFTYIQMYLCANGQTIKFIAPKTLKIISYLICCRYSYKTFLL